jgi:hypothetical protein
MSYENPWLYTGIPLEDDAAEGFVGFVYMITNLADSRMYIGKKLFKFTRSKKVKGRRVRRKIDSDWKSYYGSSKELSEDVGKLGPSNFKREVLRLCKSKGECNYWEAKYQFDHRVLELDDYYNTWISVKVHKSHINVDKRSKA